MAEHRGPNGHRRRPRRNIEFEGREALSPATVAVIWRAVRDTGGSRGISTRGGEWLTPPRHRARPVHGGLPFVVEVANEADELA